MSRRTPSEPYPRQPYQADADRPHDIAIANCEDCGDEFDLTVSDPRTRVCAPCWDRSLDAIETAFLDNYAKFGAKAHRTVAEALFRSQALADPDDRKVIGMRIVEEYLNAAQDLMALYVALRRRHEQPLLTTFTNFELNPASVAAFRILTSGRNSDDLLRDLQLPTLADVDAARGEIPRKDWRQFAGAVLAISNGIERVQKVDQGVLLELADGLKQSSALTHKMDWLPDRAMNPDQVALVVLNQRRRVLMTHALAIHEPQLEVFIDAIDKITAAARDLIWLYLHVRDTVALEDRQSGR
ncbi:MAG: hypothetical protein F4Y69_08615 [Chloroflexi bacterium]|nr:hypothetical protein [Chloroflexota bacterium]MXX81075.1 hypothetical protein [Chloroflexota bacterium]MYB22254.1 hypothetical protein [Chloroflexota bacterium]MYD17040.1 hypothetical protein [Chloroflexota bacterium]MYF23172.1 hypothetical protein [Chloroflexota bacterium]